MEGTDINENTNGRAWNKLTVKVKATRREEKIQDHGGVLLKE